MESKQRSRQQYILETSSKPIKETERQRGRERTLECDFPTFVSTRGNSRIGGPEDGLDVVWDVLASQAFQAGLWQITGSI
jgi:hypothetical protein